MKSRSVDIGKCVVEEAPGFDKCNLLNMEEYKSITLTGSKCSSKFCDHGCYKEEIPDFRQAYYDFNPISNTCWRTSYNVNNRTIIRDDGYDNFD